MFRDKCELAEQNLRGCKTQRPNTSATLMMMYTMSLQLQIQDSLGSIFSGQEMCILWPRTIILRSLFCLIIIRICLHCWFEVLGWHRTGWYHGISAVIINFIKAVLTFLQQISAIMITTTFVVYWIIDLTNPAIPIPKIIIHLKMLTVTMPWPPPTRPDRPTAGLYPCYCYAAYNRNRKEIWIE